MFVHESVQRYITCPMDTWYTLSIVHSEFYCDTFWSMRVCIAKTIMSTWTWIRHLICSTSWKKEDVYRKNSPWNRRKYLAWRPGPDTRGRGGLAGRGSSSTYLPNGPHFAPILSQVFPLFWPLMASRSWPPTGLFRVKCCKPPEWLITFKTVVIWKPCKKALFILWKK